MLSFPGSVGNDPNSMRYIAFFYRKEGGLTGRDLKLYGYRGLIVANLLKTYVTLRKGEKTNMIQTNEN